MKHFDGCHNIENKTRDRSKLVTTESTLNNTAAPKSVVMQSTSPQDTVISVESNKIRID